jgi:4-amino-4-deoxy-L-arabinose transferase-like glycosyltransferase
MVPHRRREDEPPPRGAAERCAAELPAPPAWLAGLVLLLALALRIPGAGGDLVDHDSWRQTETATIARNFVEEPRILWPRINWGAPGPGYVEAEFQLYPFAVSLLYRAFGPDPWIGRLLSMLLTGLAAIAVLRIGARFLGSAGGLIAALLFLCSPLVFRYGRAFMPEATALCCYVWALERYLRFLDQRRWRTVLTAGLAMGLAVLVKPTTVHLGLILMLVQARRQGWRAWFRPQALTFAAIALLPAALYYAHAASIHATYGNSFGVISGGDSKWGRADELLRPGFHLGLLDMDVRGTVRGLGLPFALAAVLAPPSRALRALGLTALGVLWVYYCIVGRYAGFAPRGLHYHLYAALPWALLTAAGISALARRLPRRSGLVALGLTAVIAAYQISASRWLWTARNDLRLRAGQALAAVSDPGETAVVLSHDVARDGAVRNNFEEPDVLFHAWRRGRVLARDEQSAAGLRRVLGADARWFVNFPALNASAATDFGPALLELAGLVVRGEGFELFRVTH